MYYYYDELPLLPHSIVYYVSLHFEAIYILALLDKTLLKTTGRVGRVRVYDSRMNRLFPLQ